MPLVASSPQDTTVLKRPAHLRIVFRHLLDLIITTNYIESIERQIARNEERKVEIRESIKQSQEQGDRAADEYHNRREAVRNEYRPHATAWQAESARLMSQMDRLQEAIDKENAYVNEQWAHYLAEGKELDELLAGPLDCQVDEFKQRCRIARQQVLESITSLQEKIDLAIKRQKEVHLLNARLQERSESTNRSLVLIDNEEVADDLARDEREELLWDERRACRRRQPMLRDNLVRLMDKQEALIPQMAIFRQEQPNVEQKPSSAVKLRDNDTAL